MRSILFTILLALCFTVTTPALTIGQAYAAASFKTVASLDGFIFNRTGNTTYYLSRGNYTSANSAIERSTTARTYGDMTTNGLNGLDVGSPINNMNYHVYLVSNSAGEVASLISKEISYSKVTVPDGYTVDRKLQFAFIWKDRWDDRNNADGTPTFYGIPSNHVSPDDNSKFRYTFAERTEFYSPYPNGLNTNGVWKAVDLTNFVPDNARLVDFHFETYSSNNTGRVDIRVSSIQNIGTSIGFGNSTSSFSYRVTSKHMVYIKTTGNIKVYPVVLGYYMTEAT